MKFDVFAPEHAAFRQEVRDWLAANMPKGVKAPLEERNYTKQHQEIARAIQRKLADKGWAAPRWPKEWGGGGLSVSEAAIVEEELDALDLPRVPTLIGPVLCAPAILKWGSEEQKKRFLPKLVRTDIIPWQLFTEPEAGSDLASLRTRAIPDGDSFIIRGQKVFVGFVFEPEWLWLLAVTDPSARRHQNLGAFFMPADLPGITFQRLDMVLPEVKCVVFLDDVRVSREYLIGGETQGWQVAQTTLEEEHGGIPTLATPRGVVQLLEYARSTLAGGQPLSKQPAVREALVDLLILDHVNRLLGLRNSWMGENHQPKTYHSAQGSLIQRDLLFKLAQAVLDVAGPYGSLEAGARAPYEGSFELRFREAIIRSHSGGTVEIQKLVMARSLGLGSGSGSGERAGGSGSTVSPDNPPLQREQHG